MAELDTMIELAEEWIAFYKRRGAAGRIEMLAARIRYLALLDAKACNSTRKGNAMMADQEESIAVGTVRLLKSDDEVREIIVKACQENAGVYLRELGEEIISMRQRIAKLEIVEPTLERLIEEAVKLKEGNQEFVLYRYSSTDWSANIGNPTQSVQMLEAGSEFEGEGFTAVEAVEALIKVLTDRKAPTSA